MAKEDKPTTKDPIRQAIDTRLDLAHQSTAIGRALGPDAPLRLPVPDDLVPVFEFFTAEIHALEEIVKVLATQVDQLRSR